MPSLLAKTAKNLLWLAVGPFLASCATPNSEPSYYEPPPLSSETSARPAIIEGTLEQIHTRGGLPSVLYEPETIDRVCAYVFSVDEQIVGGRADCRAAVPLSPGKHRIAAWLQADQSTAADRLSFRPATATLMFDAEEGHHYKISMDRIDVARGSARIWIHDVTTQTPVTEARLVTPQARAGGPLSDLDRP
jgi:hypothetical protein